MLSLFPSLFAWSFFGIALLRLMLAIVVGATGFFRLKLNWSTYTNIVAVGIVEVVAAAFLLIGLFTQAAAVIVILVTSINLFIHQNRGFDFIIAQLLIMTIALALLVLGPGALAIDLPL